jgi:amino acid adenylation domain-containing protein
MKALEIISKLKKNKVLPVWDGDQLKLTGEVKSLPADILQEVKTNREEIVTFLRDTASKAVNKPIPVIAEQPHYPLSNAQKRIWVLSQFEGGNQAYNITDSLYLKGKVEIALFEKAFREVIKRHQSLRTVFNEVEGDPVQIILPEVPFSINFEDLQGKIPDEKKFLKEEIRKAHNWKFNLETGPLLQVKMIQFAADGYAMIFAMHHIISDGWSIGVLVKETMSIYKALCLNQPWQMEPLTIQYKDYAAWLEDKLSGTRSNTAMQLWKSQHFDEVEPLSLPVDYTRPQVNSFEGAQLKFYWDNDLYDKIVAFARKHNTTLFNFFRATISLLLHKYANQQELIIGSPVAARNHFDLENQIGLYVNTIPLKSTYNGEQEFTGYLKNISDNSLRSFEFQDYPLDNIIELANVKRDTSRNPLFDVMLVLQNTAIGDGSIDVWTQHGFVMSRLDKYIYDSAITEQSDVSAKFDLTFNFATEPVNKHFLEIEYRTKLFKKQTVQRLYQSYLYLINQVLDNPSVITGSIEITDPEEKEKILHKFNLPVTDFSERSVQELLGDTFTRNAAKTAVRAGKNEFTYAQIQKRFCGITAFLNDTLKDTPNPRVGMLLQRNENITCSILGIIYSKAAYLPVDIKYPADRIQYIINDAAPQVLLVDEVGKQLVPPDYKGKVVLVTGIPESEVMPDTKPDLYNQLAYFIYTSGSTGIPKGVAINHKNVVAFLKWAGEEFKNTPYEILYSPTSYCFDLSVFEYFLPLIQGKAIRILESAVEIPEHINHEKNIFINTVPSAVRHLIEEGMDFSNVNALNMAGEPVPKIFKQQLDHQRMEVRNLYGPSEDTTYSTFYRFADDGTDDIPMGVPVGYTQMYILDQAKHILPVGVEGEVYLSGHSVATGYLNKDELTKERFLENPFIPGLKMYRTGDLGKWLPNGQAIYSGRIDDQVKVRGYRIELGEVQFVIEQVPGVDQAVVVVKEVHGDKHIVAYWESAAGIGIDAIKQALKQRLPEFMHPSYYMPMEAIPLNSNGKVDKKRLPEPEYTIQTEMVVPKTKMQQQLYGLWVETLKQEDFGILHNFFDLGGHSLKATKLRALIAKNMGKEITLNEVFQNPTIESQSILLDSKSKTSGQAQIIKKETREDYPLSFTQERLWVLTKFEDASKAYNMPAAFNITGNLDIDILGKAIGMVVQRHEILRTIFREKNGVPVQVILPANKVNIVPEHIILNDTQTPATEILVKNWQKPFDLENGPLLRSLVIDHPGGRILSFNMHHIISDGWSIGILFKEVVKAYSIIKTNSGEALPELELQFKDYALWQREYLTEEVIAGRLDYWKNEVFPDAPPVLELPTDFHRPEIKTYEGAALHHSFTETQLKGLTRLAHQCGASLYMSLIACVNILLKKYANQNDIVIGTPVAGREQLQLQDQIGFYINTLAIRTKMNGSEPFTELLNRQREQFLKSYEHQDFPFEMLVESLQLRRDLSRSPLFDVMVVLQNMEGLGTDDIKYLDTEIQLERLQLSSGATKYDLIFSFAEGSKGLDMELEYNTGLFTEATVTRMANHLGRIFDSVIENPFIEIQDISLLNGEEIARINAKSDQTHVRYDRDATLLSLFNEAAERFPDRTAVKFGETTLTYKELQQKSGALAAYLKEKYTIRHDDLVVLHTERSEWMIVAIFAVLKLGAAYVPVDPDYPESRIDYILTDSGAKLVLFDTPLSPAIIEKNSDTAYEDIRNFTAYDSKPWCATITPGNLAYVIYTSGTTGNPKGVLVEHGNLTRLLFNDNDLFDFDENDNWSLFHSYCFDFSVWEMYGALLKGGTVVVVPKPVAQDSNAFFNFLVSEKITVLNQTPTAFRSLLQANSERLNASGAVVRYLIFGGEALSPGILEPWQKALPGCKIINMYGITETTVHVTYKHITEKEIRENKSNIGIPIPTLSCYVLDIDMKQAAFGVTGELCVGGAGVARGYHNKPELAAEKFVPNPFVPGQRIYRSGDFARILPSGDLEYIGRKDDQVKIRGHRIETGEIEATIRQQPEVKDVVVITYKNSSGEHELVAYYVPHPGFTVNLRERLGSRLPSYMVPAYLVPLDKFPITSNGKLDKLALPLPQQVQSRQTEYVPPRNETDSTIAQIWEEVLEREKIGIQDNFFELGGHSLKATRVISRIQETFGVKVDMKNLFIDPTIEHLSDFVETLTWIDNQQNSNADNVNEELIL